MNKIKLLQVIFVVSLAILTTTQAQAYTAYYKTFTPSDADLQDLPHGSYYKWGIRGWQLPQGMMITAATLTYKNIWDWTAEPNDIIYTHLLDTVNFSGVKQSVTNKVWIYTDNEKGGDNFLNQGLLLGTWTDSLGGKPHNPPFDLVYNVPVDHFSWLSDGNFGFGIDPDCHYYNDKVTFKITYAPIPEPTSFMLMGLGLFGLVGLKKRKGKR